MIAMSRVRTALGAVTLTGLLALGGAGTPAMAQSAWFGFGGAFDQYDRERNGYSPELITCLTDNQVRRAVADLGYTNISLNVPNDSRVQVRATRKGTVYLLKFNLCTARIENRYAVRPAQ